MKLSGHNFDGDLFSSLLDNINKDVQFKPAENTPPPVMSGSEVFSSVTESDLRNIQRDELDFIASELTFAAERAKVEIDAIDLAKFAQSVTTQKKGMRGKALERAAQKYCNNLDRDIAKPQGTMKSSAELIDQLKTHGVMPAGYHDNPNGINNSVTGKFMGCSKNPNTIWDTDALQRQAQIALGDENIKASKKAEADYRLKLKTAQWQELQDKHSDPEQIHNTITNAGSSPEAPASEQKSPPNALSMFDDNRNFSTIPERTVGEEIAAKAEARANKKIASNDESREIQAPTNTRSSVDRLFDGM